MKEDVWKIIISVLGLVATVAGFFNWQFKTMNGFKDEIHRIDLKNKELEQNDKMQQEEIAVLKDFFREVNNIKKIKSHI